MTTTDQMEDKNKLIKFLLFIFIQTIISAVVIILFQQTFLLKPIIIIGHLFVICCIHLLTIVLGLLLYSKKLINYQKTTKYIHSSVYGIFIILLYYTYLFAFLGKSFNSRIFTSQIILEYVKHLNGLLEAFSVSPLLVYTGLFIIPLFILIAFLFMTQFFNHEFHAFKQFLFKHNFNNPPKYIRVNIVVFLLLIGFASGVIIVKYSSISSRLFRMEEPIVSVFFKNNDPFQGQTISNNNEDIGLRKEYPKNINFNKKNVITIVVDALRSDHLGLYGYKRKTSPFLDSLYSKGNLRKIELSFSVAAASFAGINGILRSKIWTNMGYNNFSLQQLLKDQGYDINFILSGDHTNWYGLKSFYGNNSDFNYFLDGTTTKKHSDPNDDQIIFEGLEDIGNYNNNPSFFYFHLMSAHSLGKRLDKYKIFLPAVAKKYDIENYTNRYDNGIFQADDHLNQIFKTLFAKGYLQNSIVILTADHGEALGERAEFSHGKNVYTDQILIPILIYDSDTVQYKNTKYATSLDIAPTIVDRLGLPIPESWEGNSLFSENPSEFTFHQIREHYAVIHTEENLKFKYVYNSKKHEEELYDLNTDLYETKNIIDSVDKQYLNSLRNQLSEFSLNPFK
jgi:phosphoglycerol transferase MdoB-like AlkP superfamily enzyme